MFIYGINPILESLNSSIQPKQIFIQKKKDNKRIQSIISQAEKKSIPLEYLDDLRKLVGHNAVHQGAIAEFSDNWANPLNQLPDDCEKLIVLDGITDPHNFGAAIRVAEVYGFKHILFHQGDSSGVTAVAVKSSSGAIFHCNLYYSNLNQAVKYLKKQDFSIYALDIRAESTIYDIELSNRYALVIGSEGKGVRYNIMQNSTAIKIPMQGKVDSLNVSCALSACLTEFSRPNR